MSLAYSLYNTVSPLAAPFIVGAAVANKRLKGRWRQRLGFFDPIIPTAGQRIWVHAVSFGEVQGAAAVISAIKQESKDSAVWLTTGTEAGRVAAGRFLDPSIPVLDFPLDVYGAPKRALKHLKPDLLIIMETELWPNLLREAHRVGVKTMLANARVSEGSYKNYKRFKFLFKEVLGYLDRITAIEDIYRDRFISLGANPESVMVTGSAKYDRLLDQVDAAKADALRLELGIKPTQPVFVAGSTRPGEEIIILDIFKRLLPDIPDLHLILAPRHIERSKEVENLVQNMNLDYTVRSQPKTEFQAHRTVTILDVMGELFYAYGLARVAFCGGSLVNLGGHNPLEVSAWGRPVIYGPSMQNFSDADLMLTDAGAGGMAADADELHELAKQFLLNPETADNTGRAARQMLENRPSSAKLQARTAIRLLSMDSGS